MNSGSQPFPSRRPASAFRNPASPTMAVRKAPSRHNVPCSGQRRDLCGPGPWTTESCLGALQQPDSKYEPHPMEPRASIRSPAGCYGRVNDVSGYMMPGAALAIWLRQPAGGLRG